MTNNEQNKEKKTRSVLKIICFSFLSRSGSSSERRDIFVRLTRGVSLNFFRRRIKLVERLVENNINLRNFASGSCLSFSAMWSIPFKLLYYSEMVLRMQL